MAETSRIEWTDATVNFWWGCTKVSAACDHCYAETWARRFSGQHWGAEAPRRKIKTARAMLHRLDNDYAEWAADFYSGHLPAGCGPRRRVFCMSMGDLFDKEVPLDWFVEAWRTIYVCNRVDIIIVTKRLSMIERRLGEAGFSDWPPHAWLLTSVHDQASADREAVRLLDLKSTLGVPNVGFSIEPMLGEIDLTRPIDIDGHYEIFPLGVPPERIAECEGEAPPRLDWIIAGGESGPDARPSHPDWFRGLRDQCAAARVPFFFKQWGEWEPSSSVDVYCHGPERNERLHPNSDGVAMLADGRVCMRDFSVLEHKRRIASGAACDTRAIEVDKTALAEFLGQIRLEGGRRDNPLGYQWMYRVGKRRAGRMLDGREHNGFPDMESTSDN
jgi:protein gp37